MADYEDVYAPDLAEETTSTLSGSEQFVMFDSVEGKRGSVNNVGSYILQNGDADGEGHTVAEMIEAAVPRMTKEVTGNPITVDDALGEVDSLTVDLEPIQTGTPSPSSPAPITGHTSTTITVTNGTNTKTFTAPISTTVYGGTVGVTSGTGTNKYGYVDLGTLNWGYSSPDARFYYNGIDYKRPASATDVANAKCTIYPLVKLGSLSNGTMCLYTNGYAYVKDTRYTDAASFKTAMSGVYLCYELATPTDLTTTPTDITLYNGDNVISADGDMDMVYVRDIVKVIEKLEG